MARKRTLYDAFTSGFLAGMAVVHSESVDDQQEEYFRAWFNREEKWLTKTLTKFQQNESGGYNGDD